MQRLGLAISVILLGVLTASCQKSGVGVFGSSYDECLLLNATEGGDSTSREEAAAICLRRFARKPTDDERDNVVGRSSVRVEPYQHLIVQVRNQDYDLIVTKVTTAVEFYDKPADAEGNFPAGSLIDTGVWSWDTFIEPDTEVTLEGSMDAETLAGRYTKTRTVVGRVVPYGERH